MGYVGATFPIPLGGLGLMTDAPMNTIPPNAAIRANNVSLYASRVEKSKGSSRYNTQVLDGSVCAVHDYWPTPSLQRLIAVTSAGKVYRDTGDGTFTLGVPIGTGLGALTSDTCIVEGGNEAAGSSKKLFIFTGTSQVKKITGDGTAIASIATPAADWAANYPTFGLIHNNRLWAFGNGNGRHFIYGSTTTDHENFTGAGSLVFSVFPGKSDGIVSALVYRGVMYLFKRPGGIYVLDDSSPDTVDWRIVEYSEAFGISSPHGVVQALSDIIAANNTGSLTSLSASEKFGDLESADVLAGAKVEEYIRANSNKAGIPYTHALYYPEKKLMYFTYRNVGTTTNNRMMVIDANSQQLKMTIETKDNPVCLGLRKDTSGISRPMYGSLDGYVFLMDQSNYGVNGTAYLGEYQTPHMDFSQQDPKNAEKTKLYDFLSVTYVATGTWNFFIDVYIDSVFSETLMLSQAVGAALGSFVLDVDTLSGEDTKTIRLPLHGAGNRISFRIYNNQLNQNFKVEQLLVSYRPGKEHSQG